MYYNFLIMGELITLTCPSCGGKLQVSPNTSVLICQHCGIEHLVRRDSGGVSLESVSYTHLGVPSDNSEIPF